LGGATLAAGISYQWETSSTGTGSWSPIAGATFSTYTASQTVDTYYRCALTCSNSSLTSFSTPVQVTTLPNLAGGTYTVGPTGTYPNLTAAFAAAACGVAGPVVFNVQPFTGPYTEQIILGQIPGMSATNNITVNGNNNTLQFKSNNTNERAVLKLNGTDFLTVKNLNIRAIGQLTTQFGFGVQLMNGANNNTFKNCFFQATDSVTSTNYSGFVCSNTATSATGGGLAASNLLVDSCTIIGGYYGITLGGTSATKVGLPSNNILRNSTVRDFYLYGVYTSGQSNLIVRNNDVNRATRAGTQSTLYGIYMIGRQLGTRIESNRIHDPHGTNTAGTYSQYAVYASSASGANGQPLVIANNAVYNFLTVGGIRGGFYLFTMDSARVYHNTVNFDNPNATGTSAVYGFYHSGTPNDLQVRNNIFSISDASTGVKYMLYLATTGAGINSNNNIFNFTNAGGTTNHIGYRNAAAVTTLSSWQSGSGQDALSLTLDPMFTAPSTGDLTPQSAGSNNAGANLLTVVPTDILGTARSATPDPGAFEYTPAGCPPPFMVQTSNVSSTSLSLSWSGTNSGFEVEYGPVGFLPGLGTTVTAATTSTQLTGLTPYTQYSIFLRGTCASQSLPPSVWVGPTSALTAIAPNWLEDFANGYDPLANPGKPVGWSELNGLLANPTVVVTNTSAWMEDGWLNSGTTGALRNQVPNTSNNTIGYTVTPSINLGTAPNNYMVKFDMALLAANGTTSAVMGNDDSVMVLISTNNGQTWLRSNALAKYHKNSGLSNNGTTYYVPLTNYSGLVKLAFYIESTVSSASTGATNYDIMIDNVEVTNVVPTCPAPTLSSTSTPTSVTLTWANSFGQTPAGSKIMWGPTGFMNSTTATATTISTTSPYTVSGLTPNTTYDFFVKDSCSATQVTSWVGPLTVKTPCLATLSGAYTVDPAGSGATNFTTLASAVGALNSCGITGPVTLNIASGAFTADLYLSDIPGSTPLKKVTFNGAPNLATTITTPLGGGAVFTLDGAKNIAIQNLRLVNTAGSVIRFTNNADSNSVENNLILSDTTGTATSAAIFSTGALTSPTTLGSEVDYITIKNNVIKGAYYGIALSGISTTSFDKGFLIEGNTLLKQYYYGMRLYGLEDVVIKNNRFDQSRITSSYGMYVYYTRNVDIEGNFMNAQGYGLYLYYPNYQITGTIPANRIVNNMLKGNTYGFYAYSLRDYKFYHNTCVGGTYGYYLSGTTTAGQEIRNLDTRNNIFTGNTYPFYQVTAFTTAQNSQVDHNAYQAGTGGLAYYGAAQASLTAWQTTAPTLNANSAAGNVLFQSATDFHIIGAFPNDLGAAGLGVNTDIDGQVRPATGSTAPDMGADEFTPVVNDAKLIEFFGVNGGCGSATTTVSVRVENLGLNAITSLPINVTVQNVAGGAPQVVNTTAAVNIPSLGVDTITVGTINTYNGGVFNFKGYTSLPNDGRASNDTVVKNGVNFIPFEPLVSALMDTICQGQDSIVLSAIGYPGTTYAWYDTVAGGTSLATGNSAKLPTTQNTYYVEFASVQALASVGAGTTASTSTLITPYKTFYMDGRVQYLVLASEMAAAGANPGNVNSVAFNVSVPAAQAMTDFTIKMGGTSVSAMTAYLPNTGFTTVYTNSAYTTTAGWNVHTFTTPFLWNGSDNVVVEVCFNNASYTSNSSVLYHTTTFASAFDGYSDLATAGGCTPGAVTISSAQSNRPNMQFNVTSAACSPIRKPVSFVFNTDIANAVYSATETTPGTFSFSAAGSNGDSYAWYFPGGIVATGATATQSFPAPGGPKSVILVVLDSTCLTVDSATFTVNSTIGLDENTLGQNVYAFPNPSNGQVAIVLEGNEAFQGRMEIINAVGQVVVARSVETAAGRNEFPMDLRHLAKGVYTVRVASEVGQRQIRLVLQ
jgi:hypothetical protein